jgi:hypothetical protein
VILALIRISLVTIDSPSHASGTVFEARSSIENFMSCPFSMRDSGSAFMSQYWRPEGMSGFAVFEGVGFVLVGFGTF